jgi:hypothetical protein
MKKVYFACGEMVSMAKRGTYYTSSEANERIKALEDAIRLHRKNIWGSGRVGHTKDSELYAALEVR